MNDLIKDLEGLRLSAYLCSAGVWTIGYGHTKDVKEGNTITLEEAEALLLDDLKEYKQAVDIAVNVSMKPNQEEALVSLCYNIGVSAFKKSTLVKKLNEGLVLDAAMEFPKWSKVQGERSKGLLRRRIREASLFLT